MIKVRTSVLMLACAGLLSTAAMGMAASGSGTSTPTDPMGGGGSSMGQTSPGMGSGAQTPGRSIEGEILRVQGEKYVVKDSTGTEVSLHVDHSTRKSGRLEEGDRIEAEVTADGHALSLKKAGPPIPGQSTTGSGGSGGGSTSTGSGGTGGEP